MNDVAEIDLTAMWAATSPEVLRRSTRVAQLALDLSSAVVLSRESTDRFAVRCVAGSLDTDAAQDLCATTGRILPADGMGDAVGSNPVLTVPLTVIPGGRPIGALCASARDTRAWTHEEVELLTHLAGNLSEQIVSGWRDRERQAIEQTSQADLGHLLSVVDRIPGLIFERRKIEGSKSSYTFFGRDKTRLPAVRQMMGDGTTGALRFVHRDDREAVSAALIRSTIEETDLDLTFRIKDFDRNIRWVRSQSIVRKAVDGSVAWNGMCFDISDLMSVPNASSEGLAAPPDDPAIAQPDLRAPLAAIVQIAAFIETEAQSPLVTAHARTLRSNVEALMKTIRLDDAPPEQKPPATPVAAFGRTRILLADDLDLNRKLIADMLSLEGHLVDCVSDGAEALKAVGLQRYDLILMDMMMPGMDGLAATRAIRALPAPAGTVPIVALTANSTRDQLEKCLMAGMNATLTKPMSFDELANVVASWIHCRTEAA